jgi:predicted kinase
MDGLKTLPILIFVFGLPGSGKSFFASQLATLLKMEYLNSDKIRMKILSKRIYSDDEKRKVYESMMSKMDMFLRSGKSVVLDATFYKKDIRSMFLNKADGKARVFFIEVKADEELIHQRLQILVYMKI